MLAERHRSGLGAVAFFWRSLASLAGRPSLEFMLGCRPRIPCRRRANPPMTTTASKGACASRPSPVLREEAASWIGLVCERLGVAGDPPAPARDGLRGAVRRLADSLRHTRGGAGGDGVLARDQPCEVAGYRPDGLVGMFGRSRSGTAARISCSNFSRIRFSSRHIPPS